MNIGILEDDLPQGELLCEWLTAENYSAFHCTEGSEFIQLLKTRPLDLVILDWQLPDTTGLDVLNKIRLQLNLVVPVIFATQRDSEQDIVTALKAGADDYLVKPLRHAELMARISAVCRRAGIGKPSADISLGPISIDTTRQIVKLNGETVKMTSKDYDVACLVLSNEGKLLSREYLLKQIWGLNSDINTRTVDVHISRVRRRLKIGPEMGYCIKTIYQHGYRLEKITGM